MIRLGDSKGIVSEAGFFLLLNFEKFAERSVMTMRKRRVWVH